MSTPNKRSGDLKPEAFHMNTSALQTDALMYFMKVAYAGSISEAAERLGVAPSAVSRQIAGLERALDTLLFERKARGMVLNAAGELLAAHARRSWQDIEQVGSSLLALRGLRTGQVRLAATEGFGHELLPRLIAAFQSRRPGVVFAIESCSQAEVMRRVREGESDLGVTVGMAPERGVDVQFRHLSPVLAVMSCTHPLAQKRQISLAQAAAYPLALPVTGSTLRQLLDMSCARQNLRLSPVLTSSHLYPLINYVAFTQAITFCGESALRMQLATGQISAVALKDREMYERYFMVVKAAGRQLGDAAAAFTDQITEDLENLGVAR